MKTGIKLIIGGVTLVGGYLLFSSFKSSSKTNKTTNNSSAPNTVSKATASQFDDMVSLANSKKSDLFTGLSTEQLAGLRSDWMKHLSRQEADILLSLLAKDESTWKASDKINFDYYMNKWRLHPTATPVKNPSTSNTPPKPAVVSPTDTNSSGIYDPTRDSNYQEKVDILSKWYDYIVATNKKRTIPKYVPSKNKFEAKFLPWTVNDLNAYTGLVYMGKENRGVRENDIMDNIKQKYPESFKGFSAIYNFNGNPIQLANKSSVDL